MSRPAEIVPDDKDWTFVITDGCTACGFVPPEPQTVAERLLRTTPSWQEVLARPEVSVRPEPQVWSPLEYACHARDVCRVFDQRLRLMLTDDDAHFANWDQDAAAVTGRYFEQDPAVVSTQYESAAAVLADGFAAVTGEQWDRRGLRSNGSAFTVATLSVYLLHDLEHHLFDVAALPR